MVSLFGACEAPSAEATTRNTYKLTGGDGLQQADRKKLVDKLCDTLNVRFEDT